MKDRSIIVKKAEENECKIAALMQKYKHFPKIDIFTLERQNYIFMKYYKHNKIKFDAEFNYVKNYIKSLLLCLNKMHKKNYIHGDVKPDNFININKKNYYLIDFDFSVMIGSENPNKCSYPYNAPEKNNYTLLYNKASEKSDIWSVGIILLFFYIKSYIYSKYFIANYYNFSRTNFSSLAEYVLIYGNNIENYIVR